MSCDSNENELKLAKDYKYLLSYIRPLIDQLDKSRDAQMCLLWLSKLEQCDSWEKNYRNKILTELCKQVKANCLKPPFNTSPPSGPLRRVMWPDWKTGEWMSNECSEIYASTEEVFSSSSHHSFNSLRNIHQHHQLQPSFWKGGFCNSLKNKTSKPVKELLDHSECFAIQKAYHDRAQSDQSVIEKYRDIVKSLVSQQLKTDVSPGKLKKLRSAYESKMSELMQSFQKERKENEALKRKIESFEGDVAHLEVLRTENEGLKKRIYELENEKNGLEIKCKEADEEKFLTLSDLISKLNESEKKLKESEKRCKSLERQSQNSFRDFELELENQASEKEKLHLAKVNNLEKMLEEKQLEINNLKEQMNTQNVHFGQEISRLKQQLEENHNLEKDKEKIKNLKNKAKKLEKTREHMTVLFQSQLQQILAKKDFYIASLEMQLKMNNSEIGGGNVLISDFNNSLDQKISNLEAQYKKLLEDSEEQSIKRRQLDLQKIHTLEKQLLSYGGVVLDESDMEELKTGKTP